MQQVKPFYKSKGVIGSIVVLVGVIVQALGYTFGPDEQQLAVTLVSAIIEALGGLVALWGRITATKQIKTAKPASLPAAGLLLLVCVGLALGGSGCASKEEVLAYYNAQVLAQQAKATVESQKKPLLRIEAKDGQDISFTGLKALEVYAPTCDDGKGYKVAQHKDPAYSVGTTVLSIAAGVAGIWLSGQNMVDLANAVGQHAGRNTTVQGDYTRDGSTKYGGDYTGGDRAGRDITRDSHNSDSHDQPTPSAPAE